MLNAEHPESFAEAQPVAQRADVVPTIRIGRIRLASTNPKTQLFVIDARKSGHVLI